MKSSASANGANGPVFGLTYPMRMVALSAAHARGAAPSAAPAVSAAAVLRHCRLPASAGVAEVRSRLPIFEPMKCLRRSQSGDAQRAEYALRTEIGLGCG